MQMTKELALIYALLAATLFGLSAPLSKLLLDRVEPLPLASLLYLGAGLGVGLVLLLQRNSGKAREARLTRTDLPWLITAILAGGVGAPIGILYGLRATPAATASLLLNFEVVATAGIAALAFREHTGRRTWLAVGAITAASILLSLDPGAGGGFSTGALLILAACILWGIDNNATGRISLKDPKRIVTVKGLAAGSVSALLAIGVGQSFPSGMAIVYGLLLGAISYGASIVLFVRSLRSLGAARTGALFGTAPFIGMALSLVIFREPPGLSFYLSLPIMLVGAWLLTTERHSHLHVHTPMEHDHAHQHSDAHHDHEHPEIVEPGLSHSHPHRHESTTHEHPHSPDAHHRHTHDETTEGE